MVTVPFERVLALLQADDDNSKCELFPCTRRFSQQQNVYVTCVGFRSHALALCASASIITALLTCAHMVLLRLASTQSATAWRLHPCKRMRCRFAGLTLAARIPQQGGYTPEQHAELCCQIHAAAWPFVRRLLMPLRNPDSIAMIQEQSKLEQQLLGAPRPHSPQCAR